MELICHATGIVLMMKKSFIYLTKNIICFFENMVSMDLWGLVCAISFFRMFFEIVMLGKLIACTSELAVGQILLLS